MADVDPRAKLVSIDISSAIVNLVDPPAQYNESPDSAKLVAEGLLPPVEERLPDDPIVFQVPEIGQYGGELRRVHLSPGDINCSSGRIASRGFLTPSGDGTGWIPLTGRSWSPNEDATVWTLKLPRNGKWSDGFPHSARDFLYQYEVQTDTEIKPRQTKYIRESGDPIMTFVQGEDEWTVEFRYSAPNWLMEYQMHFGCTPVNAPFKPAHYLEPFNLNYNPEANNVAEAAGYDGWVQYYTSFAEQPQFNVDLPGNSAWIYDDPRDVPTVRFSRNHYFVWVDQAGNQLPYIGNLRFGPMVSGTDGVNLAAAQGLIDLQGRHMKFENFPLFKENEEKGGYVVNFVRDDMGSDVAIYWNLTYDGPERLLLENREWRIAMSYAIDRDSINETTFLGEGTGRNALPASYHAFYPGAEYERKFGTYEPELANSMLDGLMGPKDSEGFRTLLNGDRFEFVISSRDAYAAMTAGAELLCRDIEQVGVRCLPEVLGGSLLSQRARDNDVMSRTTWAMGAADVYVYSGVTLPIGAGGTWGAEWGKWYASQGKEGEEPPAEVRRLYDLFASAGLTKDAAVNNAQEMHKWIVDNKVMTGVVGGIGSYGMVVIDNDLANWPEFYANRVTLNTPNTAFPEQFWFRSEERRAQTPR
jgi:peptide/nickel transport system substrate-binding protein